MPVSATAAKAPTTKAAAATPSPIPEPCWPEQRLQLRSPVYKLCSKNKEGRTHNRQSTCP